MKNIIFYARLVQIASYLLMPAIAVGFFIKWLSPELSLPNPHLFGLFLSYTFNDYTTIGEIIPAMPFINRLAGMFFDGISFGLLIMIFYLVAEIMKRFQSNDTFSVSTVGLFTLVSKCAFYLALYTPINRTILSVITTLHVTPHTLGISFGSTDLFNIVTFGFLMVMTLLMQQAATLQQEQSLTI
jgi:hypothetical protein